MGKYLIDFNNIRWESAYPGQRQKVHVEGNHRLRLVELSDNFSVEDWCKKEHLGYVLKGSMSIIFSNGKSMTFNEGNGMVIPPGEEHKHKGRIAKGEKLLVFFVDNV